MNSILKAFFFLIFANVSASAEDALKSIFDGKSFDGWEGKMEYFRIEGGAIVAGNLNSKIPNNEFLASKEVFGDFELHFEAKLIGEGKNAGVQFWSERIPNNHEMIGYQCDIGLMGKEEEVIWGYLYDESRRRKFLAKGDQDKLKKAVKKTDWNQFRIKAVGKRIQIWVNGVQTVDYTEKDANIPAKGRFGLQIHSGPPAECWYRNLKIRRLSK